MQRNNSKFNDCLLQFGLEQIFYPMPDRPIKQNLRDAPTNVIIAERKMSCAKDKHSI